MAYSLAGVLVCAAVFRLSVGRARVSGWHMADRWRTVADMSMLAGASLAACAVLLALTAP